MKKHHYHLVFAILGLAAAVYHAFKTYHSYQVQDDFRLFMRGILTIIFIAWATQYFLKYLRESKGNGNPPRSSVN